MYIFDGGVKIFLCVKHKTIYVEPLHWTGIFQSTNVRYIIFFLIFFLRLRYDKTFEKKKIVVKTWLYVSDGRKFL